MAQPSLPPGLLPSLKDRLIDPDSVGTRAQPGYTLVQILESVREDLEELLNTRRSHERLDSDYPELGKSIVAYGLPDLSTMSASTAGKQEAMARLIEKAILQNEPRLRNVRANVVWSRAFDLRAHFHIEAELRVTPSPRIAFETEIELTTGYASIREGAS